MRFLKSITANGTQYINTGILCNGSTHLKLDVEIPSAKSAQQQILSAVSSGNYSIFSMNNAGVWQTRYGTQASKTFANSAPGRAIYEKNGKDASLTVNGSTYTASFTANTFSMTQPLFLFCRNNGGTADLFASGTFYGLIVYDAQGNIAQHFRPAMDDNEVPCVCEEIGGTFIYNAGSGVFAYEEFPEPINQCLMARRGYGSGGNPVPTYIYGTFRSGYFRASYLGVNISRNIHFEAVTGEIINFQLYGSQSDYYVRVNGDTVIRGEGSAEYDWVIPDDAHNIDISCSWDEDLFYSTVRITYT